MWYFRCRSRLQLPGICPQLPMEARLAISWCNSPSSTAAWARRWTPDAEIVPLLHWRSNLVPRLLWNSMPTGASSVREVVSALVAASHWRMLGMMLAPRCQCEGVRCSQFLRLSQMCWFNLCILPYVCSFPRGTRISCKSALLLRRYSIWSFLIIVCSFSGAQL